MARRGITACDGQQCADSPNAPSQFTHMQTDSLSLRMCPVSFRILAHRTYMKRDVSCVCVCGASLSLSHCAPAAALNSACWNFEASPERLILISNWLQLGLAMRSFSGQSMMNGQQQVQFFGSVALYIIWSVQAAWKVKCGFGNYATCP